MASQLRGLALFCSIVLTATLWSLAPAEAASAEAQRLLSLLNGARSRSGLAPISFDPTLNSIAQGHAQRMASQGKIFHNGSYPSGAGSYQSYGENVGSSSGNIDDVHRAFMNSATHRANILKPAFNLVGIGVARYAGGVMVVQDFISRAGVVARSATPRKVSANKAPAPQPPAPPPPPPPPPPKVERPMYARMERLEGYMADPVDAAAPVPPGRD